VLRTALKPRWLALFALLVLIIVTFAELGLWQLHVAQDKGLAEALRKAHEARPVMVDAVVRPHQPFPNAASARPVIAIGSYAADGQVLVGPRRLDDREGYWVVTPLVVDGTGARLAVVRGFVADAADAGTPPQEPVQVTGALAPGESPAQEQPSPTGAKEPVLGALDLAVLVNRWPGELYNAFVFAQGEQQVATRAAVVPGTGLERVPPPQVTGGIKWRNAAYALQWWVFAAFAAFMWVKMVREDARRE
jgi:cytochrome oxidase assembly protein ShyY1